MTEGPDLVKTAESASRAAARLTMMTGKLVIVIATCTTVLCAIPSLMFLFLGHSWVRFIPIILTAIFVVCIVVLELERKKLLKELDESKPGNIIDAPGSTIDDATFNQSGPHSTAMTATQRFGDAKSEYRTRRSTPFPRVEAAQRAATEYLGGTVNSPWLQRDVRWTMAKFAAVIFVIPASIVTGSLTFFTALIGALL